MQLRIRKRASAVAYWAGWPKWGIRAMLQYMRAFKSMRLALAFFGAATAAQAQLVHLRFSDFSQPFIWQADSASVPWNMATGKLQYFEIYYDLATATVTHGTPGRPESDPDNFYSFTDPTRNFWRFQVTGPENGASFTVTHPLGTLSQNISWDGVGSQELSLSYWSVDDSSAFDLRMFLAGVGAPVPPLKFQEVRLNYLSGGPAWFDLSHLAEGYLTEGESGSAAATIVPDVGFAPIPEPINYGMIGVAVLALAAFRRRFSGARTQ